MHGAVELWHPSLVTGLPPSWRVSPGSLLRSLYLSKVEMWRGGVGLVYLFPALSSAGASLPRPCSVSTSRLSNRTGAIHASGSRRKHHAFAHEKLAVR